MNNHLLLELEDDFWILLDECCADGLLFGIRRLSSQNQAKYTIPLIVSFLAKYWKWF